MIKYKLTQLWIECLFIIEIKNSNWLSLGGSKVFLKGFLIPPTLCTLRLSKNMCWRMSLYDRVIVRGFLYWANGIVRHLLKFLRWSQIKWFLNWCSREKATNFYTVLFIFSYRKHKLYMLKTKALVLKKTQFKTRGSLATLLT